MSEHGGSGAKYASEGCRCYECRAANTARVGRRRKERDISEFTGEHGKPSTYSNWSCRCPECKAAWSVEMKRQYNARRVA